jgi:hypothetical protein
VPPANRLLFLGHHKQVRVALADRLAPRGVNVWLDLFVQVDHVAAAERAAVAVAADIHAPVVAADTGGQSHHALP